MNMAAGCGWLGGRIENLVLLPEKTSVLEGGGGGRGRERKTFKFLRKEGDQRETVEMEVGVYMDL